MMIAEATQPTMTREQTRTILIRKVAVLGAGTMGSRIAAHLANAGIPVVLLDIVPPALDALRKAKPAALFEDGAAGLITPGTFDDNMQLIADCDWIIEAVTENLDIKRALLARVQSVRKPGSIVTTNTSGLPVSQIVEGMPEELRRNWFGTHFF